MNNQNTEYRNLDAQIPTDAEITKAIRSDVQAFIPPPQVKVDIFKSLNFASPAVGTSSAGSMLSILKKSAIPIAAGLAIYFASTFNYQGLNNQTEQISANQSLATHSSSVNAEVPNNTVHRNESGNTHSFPLVSSKSEDAVTSHIAKKSVKSTVGTYSSKSAFAKVESEESMSTPSNEADNNTINSENQSVPRIALAYSELIKSRAYKLSSVPNFSSSYRSIPSVNFDYSPSSKNGFTLSVRGLASSSFADNYNFSSSLTNSFAFGIYTSLSGSDQFSIGIEAGREPFQKKYFDKYTPNQLSYIDNPNTIWGAIGVKMKLSNIEFAGLNLRPYSSVLLGAGAIGPMGRISAGIEHNISSNISAFVAAEGSTMLYNNRVNWYSSNKFGLTFGLNYQF